MTNDLSPTPATAAPPATAPPTPPPADAAPASPATATPPPTADATTVQPSPSTPLSHAALADTPAFIGGGASPPASTVEGASTGSPLTESHPAEVHAAEAAGQPELPQGEPPRALVPGAFLKLHYEIRQVLARGMTNLYVADAGGGYGDSALKLVAEREVPAAPAASSTESVEEGQNPAPANPESAPSGDVSSANDPDQLAAGALPSEAASDNIALPVVESAAPTYADLQPQPTASSAPTPIFPVPEDSFEQEGREYAVFEYQPSTALQDYREPTNDERYLALLTQLCSGMAELQSHGLSANWSRDLLRVDAGGALHYFGFSSENGARNADPMEELRALNGFLLGRVLAEERTMRLDDPWASLALSQEALEFAAALEEGRITSPQSALEELQALGMGRAPKADSALLSDVGMEREINEDSGLVLKGHRAAHLGSYAWELYVVADGMGGHEGGEVASDLTLSALQNALMERSDLNWNDNGKVRAALLEVIGEVNEAVVSLTQTPKYMAMRNKPGSTLTFALRLGARLFVGNVGDSRTYLWNAQKGLYRVSKDHSYVQTMIDAGQITEDQAWDHPDGNIITAHIGELKGRTKDVFLRLVKPGDKLLLVSDGVVDMLRDSEIAPFLQENNPATVVQNLVDASNAAGGADNITAVCVVFS